MVNVSSEPKNLPNSSKDAKKPTISNGLPICSLLLLLTFLSRGMLRRAKINAIKITGKLSAKTDLQPQKLIVSPLNTGPIPVATPIAAATRPKLLPLVAAGPNSRN